MEPQAQAPSSPAQVATPATLGGLAQSPSANPPAQRGTRGQSARSGRVWTRVVPALVFLAAILTFVFQNLRDAKVDFITLSGRFPVGLALLVAATLGGLFVLVLASVQIYHLRRVIRRYQKNDARDRASGSAIL